MYTSCVSPDFAAGYSNAKELLFLLHINNCNYALLVMLTTKSSFAVSVIFNGP